MIETIPFMRFDGDQKVPLFRVFLDDGRLYAAGKALSDAIFVLSRPVELGERKISPVDRPLDFFKSLPMVYGQDPLTAGESVRIEDTLADALRSSPALAAYKDVLEYVIFDAGQLADARGEPVPLDFIRRIEAGAEDGWKQVMPLGLILRLLGSTLPVPMPEEVSREFFAVMGAFRREYENWKALYRNDENWKRVMVGNLALPHMKEFGLWEKVGRKFYPAIEPRKFGFAQGWLAPVPEPGVPDRVAAVVADFDRFPLVRSAIADFGQIKADLFLVSVYDRSVRYPQGFEQFCDWIGKLPERRRPGGPVTVIVGPHPSEPTAPWAEFRWDSGTGKFSRTLWEL